MTVPFFDASAQYLPRKTEIDCVFQDVLMRGEFINGKEVREFAGHLAAYLKIGNVIPCGNGTDAISLALMALDLKRGDEVIVPAFNFVASAEAVALLGLVPVFVDADINDFNIDCQKIEEHISSKTRAIIVVHLFGASTQMEEINSIAEKYQLFVIEDVAQSLGSSYKNKKLGTLGHIGCTSFFPTKNLACFGDGGAVFTNNNDLAKKVAMLASHGQERKYEHQIIGLNSRLDTLQASVLNVQLGYLDADIERRRVIAQKYFEALKPVEAIKLPSETVGTFHSFNQYCILLPNKEKRDSLKDYLQQYGIGTMVYYPKPLHLQEAFVSFNQSAHQYPISENLCGRVLALPVFPSLKDEQQEYITGKILDFFTTYAN